MTPEQQNRMVGLSGLVVVAGIVLIVLDHPYWALLCFIAGGLGIGNWSPPGGEGSGIHGASDST